MELQLRVYTVRSGEMTEWISEWHRYIAPLRRKFGFDVLGPWVMESEEKFVWILGYGDELGWAEADAVYYESEERRAIEPDPARHIAHVEKWMMRPV